MDSESSESLPSPTTSGDRWVEPNRIVRQSSSGSGSSSGSAGSACLDPLTPRAAAARQSASAALRAVGRPWVRGARGVSTAAPIAQPAPAPALQLESLSSTSSKNSSGSSDEKPPLASRHHRPAVHADTDTDTAAVQSADNDAVSIRHGRLQFAGDKREVVNEQACHVSDAHVAPWAVVRARRDQYQSMPKPSYRFARLEGLRKTLHLMQHEWKLEVPSLIISVTGDASKSFDLRPEYHRMFTHALVNASLRTKAWIITGGSNRGIMKAMGDALGSYHATTPCIGIATWGTIHGRGEFDEPSVGVPYEPTVESAASSPRDQAYEERARAAAPKRNVECITEEIHERLVAVAARLCQGGQANASIDQLTPGELGAAAQRDRTLRALTAQQLALWLREQQQDARTQNEKTWVDPNHSHYVFVDDGSSGEYQGEVAFRAELEDMIGYCGFDVGDESARYELHRKRVLVDVFREHLDAADFEVADAQTLDCPAFERLVRKVWQSSFCRQPSDASSKSEAKVPPQPQSRLPRQGSFGLNPSPGSRASVPVRVRPRMRSTMSATGDQPPTPQDARYLRRLPSLRKNEWMSPEELREIFDLIDQDGSGEIAVTDLLGLLDENGFLDQVPTRRMMPVVLFVYGGGAGTFRTIDEAVGRGHSIIVVPQSGRAAHAIHKWKQASPVDGDDNQKEQLLLTLFSEQEISTFTGAVRGGKSGLIGLLDDICSYQGLYFFELDRETTSNDLLDLMVQSLVDSPVIDDRVKVPLALQYDATPAIRTLLTRGGITKCDGDQVDSLADCRPYLFAAYHDKAETCRHLLDYGVDNNALDRLILCELRSDEISQAQRKRFLTRKHLSDPPPWWVGSVDQWDDLEREERLEAYLPEPADWKRHRDGPWSALPQESQIDTHLFAHGAVTWSKLFGPPKAHSNQDLANDVVTAVLGLDHKALFSSPELFRGGHSLLSEDRTKSTFARWTKGLDRASNPAEGCGCCGKDEDDDASEEFGSDDRGSNLDLLSVSGPQSYSLWHADYGKMYERARENPLSDIHRIFWAVATRRYKLARLLWERSADPVATAFAAAWAFRNLPDAHMNEDDRESEANSYDQAATAIIKKFQESADAKQETAFLQQYLYFSNADDDDSHGSAPAEQQEAAAAAAQPRVLQRVWSMPAESMRNLFDGKRRDELAAAGGGDVSGVGRTGKGSPHPLYGCLSASQRLQNTAVRDGLILMGFEGLEPTRLDMAVTARCKMVLSLDSVEEFMDMLWTRPTCGRTRVLERILLGGVAPRLKCKLHIASESLFLVLFVSVFFGLEPGRAGVSWGPDQPANVYIEGVFWFWVGSLLIEELRQLYHAGRSALYIQSSVNKLDVVIMLFFIVALGFHIFELSELGGNASDWVVQLHESSHRIMHGLLCCDVILVAVRLLYMLAAVSRRLAILLIMTKRMIFEDVRPFLVFAAFVVVSFELAAYHFSHTLNVSHRFLSFFGLLLDVGELDGIDPRGPFYAELPEWDVPSLEWRVWLGVFKVVYVVVAVVVLMNLLIAMMSNTYSRIQEQSTTEWRLLFAELVKEYTETPLLPPPLSVLQYTVAGGLKLAIRCGGRATTSDGQFLADAGVGQRARECAWGRHLSPTTSFMLAFQLDVAAEAARRGSDVNNGGGSGGSNA
eukprot:COSAG06_NODE_2792_length_6276_cov_13.340780_2_plen_1650_part_00